MTAFFLRHMVVLVKSLGGGQGLDADEKKKKEKEDAPKSPLHVFFCVGTGHSGKVCIALTAPSTNIQTNKQLDKGVWCRC